MVFGFGQVYILTPYHFVNTYTFIHLLPIFPLVAKSKKSRFFLFWTGSTSMGKSAKLEKGAAVIALAKAGHDAAFIHNLTGYNKQFVYEWFARAQKGEPMEDRPRAGRPSKLTRAAKNYILQSTIGKRRRSTRVVARDLIIHGSIPSLLMKKYSSSTLTPIKRTMLCGLLTRIKYLGMRRSDGLRQCICGEESACEVPRL